MTNATRTDIHTLKNMDPAAYTAKGAIYLGGSEEIMDMCADVNYDLGVDWRDLVELICQRGWTGGHFHRMNPGADSTKWVGRCDHCGARFNYGTVLEHKDGDVIVVGWQCAKERFACVSRVDLDQKRLRKRIAKAREMLRLKKEGEAFIAEHNLGTLFYAHADHRIIADLHKRCLQYGSLSEKQVALAKKIAAEQDERARHVAEGKATEPVWQDVTEGRRVMTGTVLAAKWKETDFGSVFKMLVHVDGDEKVWGTVPQSLWFDDEGQSLELRGKRITFKATVERSRKDTKFGIFKRPTNAAVLTEQAAA